MKTRCSVLVAILAVLLFVPPAIATDKDGDEHPVLRWDQHIDTTSRFAVLSAFGGAAVRDNETGLVWEQSPSKSGFQWSGIGGVTAASHCNQLTTGSRLGWRLPTLQELASLVDPTQSDPSLPSGHPFSNVQSSAYWSATTLAGSSGIAWAVDFSVGAVNNLFAKGFSNPVWCVRGGQGVDPQ